MHSVLTSVLLLFCLLSLLGLHSFAQQRTLPTDTTVVTPHQIQTNSGKISYVAETGMQPVWNDKDEVVAGLNYTYYRRTDVGSSTKRPLLISFNGGPGSASVWMHMAYTGPYVINIDEEGYPIQPYGYSVNPFTILDVADLLYVNPARTGYSRVVKEDGKPKEPHEYFFGINADIDYLAEWINTFVSRHQRWLSPKYLIGESYGGTRVSGLAYKLQQSQWMYLNGVILVSPADYRSLQSDSPIATALNLPYFAATAWHHGLLPAELQNRELEELLPEVEEFALSTYMPALTQGGFLPKGEQDQLVKKLAYYTGLTEQEIRRQNLDITKDYFWKNALLDEKGQTIGRLDSRYTGIDRSDVGNSLEHYPELESWMHAFTPPMNHYIREKLNFRTDVKYNMLTSVQPWDRRNNTTRDDLRKAVAQNPFLNVMFQVGYYDGGTPYFHSKYTMWQLDPSGKLQDRLSFKGYRSGHMMYLRREDLQQANQDVRDFILKSAKPTKAARYD